MIHPYVRGKAHVCNLKSNEWKFQLLCAFNPGTKWRVGKLSSCDCLGNPNYYDMEYNIMEYIIIYNYN